MTTFTVSNVERHADGSVWAYGGVKLDVAGPQYDSNGASIGGTDWDQADGSGLVTYTGLTVGVPYVWTHADGTQTNFAAGSAGTYTLQQIATGPPSPGPGAVTPATLTAAVSAAVGGLGVPSAPLAVPSFTDADGLRYTRQRDCLVTPHGSGVDDTSRLQTALDSCAGTEIIVRAVGSFVVSSNVIIKGHFDGSGAVFTTTSSDIGVQIGPGTSGVRFTGYQITTPKVTYASKPTTGWTAGTAGVKIVNASRCRIFLQRIVGFETNLWCRGVGTGVDYNSIHLAHLDNGKINLLLSGDATGWCNQNTFVGGGCSHNSGEGTHVSGTRHIRMEMDGGAVNNGPNNNSFVNVSLESPTVVEYVLDVDNGSFNLFTNCRWEYTGGGAPIRWGALARKNIVFGGFNLDSATETFVTGQFGNSLYGSNKIREVFSANLGGHIFENGGSSNYGYLTGIRAGGTALGDDPTSNYVWTLSGTQLAGKRYNDTQPRILIDFNNGFFATGDGTATPNAIGASGQQTFTSSGSFVVPAGVTSLKRVTSLAGGGGGGGGGSPSSGILQAGGGGGGTGGVAIIENLTVTPGETLTVTVGAAGTAGTSGAAGGNPGGAGGVGGTTKLSRGGTNLTGATGGGGGAGSAASSVTVVGGGLPAGGSSSTSASLVPGAGGTSGSTAIMSGPVGLTMGGGGGGAATASLGGGGGGSATDMLIPGSSTARGTGGVSGASGTTAGVNGTAATQLGCGGGGGGGGANGGAGGTGGAGGAGMLAITW